MSERERQRHEWRARVDAAAREWQLVKRPRLCLCGCRAISLVREFIENKLYSDKLVDAVRALDAALAAPKPWRKT